MTDEDRATLEQAIDDQQTVTLRITR